MSINHFTFQIIKYIAFISSLFPKVDIFFRRALFQKEGNGNERIFCLMNADKLQYDASEQSLRDVTEYIKSTNGGIYVLRLLPMNISIRNKICLVSDDASLLSFHTFASIY